MTQNNNNDEKILTLVILSFFTFLGILCLIFIFPYKEKLTCINEKNECSVKTNYLFRSTEKTITLSDIRSLRIEWINSGGRKATVSCNFAYTKDKETSYIFENDYAVCENAGKDFDKLLNYFSLKNNKFELVKYGFNGTWLVWVLIIIFVISGIAVIKEPKCLK